MILKNITGTSIKKPRSFSELKMLEMMGAIRIIF
jgi:hypothetical protein